MRILDARRTSRDSKGGHEPKVCLVAVTESLEYLNGDTIEDKIQVIPLDASQLDGPPESIPQRSFASYSDTSMALKPARSTIIPLIVQALERNWDATFGKSQIVSAAGTEKFWFGTVGRTHIQLSFSKDGSVDLALLGDKDDRNWTLLGDKDDKDKESSGAQKKSYRAQNAMARATFQAIEKYLNDRLREPDWQEQLIKP